MEKAISFTLNGGRRTVTTNPDRSLLEVLREDLHLTGTKYGCGEGDCRVCTVLIDGRHEQSCLTPLGNVAGKEVLTIEGLMEGGALHPMQEAFLAEDAFQCGTCTPGMILTAISLLKQNPHPTDEEMVSWMDGSLCRCCGYPRILNAIRRAASQA
jgi:aerobic-type carbon monoxide dehydrogenase small subunit (CoxS/CutS family)